MGKTRIEYVTDVWNPITGCDPVSEGCKNCYAKRMATRLRGRCGYPQDDPFRVTIHRDRLEQPLHWKKPRWVFVCSMGDLFHEDVPNELIFDIFEIMLNAQWVYGHRFLVLTKRPARMKAIIEAIRSDLKEQSEPIQLDNGMVRHNVTFSFPLNNIWLGVTAENQARADERIPILLEIPAEMRFVSVEPMLGPVNLSHYLVPKNIRKEHADGSISLRLRPSIKWVIVGGETGPGARPMHPDWVRDLQRQCYLTCTKFFFKSWGEFCYPDQMTEDTYREVDAANNLLGHGDYHKPWRVGKRAAGHFLDGDTWSECPRMEVSK